MTPVQGTTANTVNWQALLDKVVETSGAAGAAKISDANRTLVLTTTVNGAAATITVNIPDDLDLPDEVDEAAITSLVQKLSASGANLTQDELKVLQEELTKVYKDMSAALNQVTKNSTGSVMLDLYKLMALMVEIGQSQRDAARELRTAQSAQLQNSIQNQADMQRDAAIVGLVIGVVCGAASVIASCVMVGLQGSAYKDQLSAARTSGTDAAQSNANMLKGADTAAHANAQLQKVEGQVGQPTAGNVKQTMDGQLAAPKARVEKAEVALAEKQSQLEHAQNELAALKSSRDTNPNALQDAQAAVDQTRAAAGIPEGKTAAKAKFDYVRDCAKNREATNPEKMTKFDAAIQAENKLTEVKELPGKISAKEQEISNIRAERDDARTELSAAKSDYRAAIKNAADAYADSYEAAVAEHGHESEAATTARDEMRMAQAYGASKLAEDGVSTTAEHRADVLGAKDRVDRATQRLNANDDYRGALHRIERYTAMNAINTALNNMIQGMSQNIAGMISAEANRKGAEQEQEKDQLEQTKDLFQQAQSLIDAVVQLMQAVSAAESQSMRDAIQA